MDPYPSSGSEPFLQSAERSAWHLLKRYWQSQNRFPVYVFFTLVIIMTAPLVGIDMIYNYWYNYFYEVLQSYDQHGIPRFLIIFSSLNAFYLALAIYRLFITKLFGVSSRRWLIKQFVEWWPKWKKEKMRLAKRHHRVFKEEMSTLINFSIDLSLVLIGLISAFLIFIYYLWLVTDEFAASSYLLLLGVLYGMIGIIFTIKFGRSFTSFIYENCSTRLRKFFTKRSSERIESAQKKPPSLFVNMMQKQSLIRIKQKISVLLAMGYNQVLVVVPLMVALPSFLYRAFLIAWFIQTLQAFNRVKQSLPEMTQPCTPRTYMRMKKKNS